MQHIPARQVAAFSVAGESVQLAVGFDCIGRRESRSSDCIAELFYRIAKVRCGAHASPPIRSGIVNG